MITTNMTSTSNILVNANRTPIVTPMLKISKVSSGKENRQQRKAKKSTWNISRATINQILPISSISRNVTATSTKLCKGNKLNAIISQLRDNVSITSVCNTGEEMILNNTANNNNNNNNNVNHINKTKNQSSPDSLLPEFSEALSCCTKLLQWLENYGWSICTFQQIDQVRTVLNILTNLPKEIESED